MEDLAMGYVMNVLYGYYSCYLPIVSVFHAV